MKSIYLLLLFISFSAQAQIFEPHQEQFDFLMEMFNKKDNYKLRAEFKKQFTDATFEKPYGNYRYQGYLSPQKNFKVFTAFYDNKFHQISIKGKALFSANYIHLKEQDAQTLFDKIVKNKWLNYILISDNKLYGFYPGTNILVQITVEDSDSKIVLKHGFKAKSDHRNFAKKIAQNGGRNISEEIAKVNESKMKIHLEKVGNSYCNKPLITEFNDFEAPTIPKGGICIENCFDETKKQTWHYGNAKYVGLVKNGVPHTKLSNGKYAWADLYVFDIEDCGKPSRKYTRNYRTTFDNGKDVEKGKQYITIYEDNPDILTKMFGPNEKIRVEQVSLNSSFQPTSKDKYYYRYFGKIINGKLQDNPAKIYHKENDLYYLVQFKDNKPDFSKEVVIIKGEKKNSKKHYYYPKKPKPTYVGTVNSNWEPEGKATRIIDRSFDGKPLYKITAHWRGDDNIDLSKELLIVDYQNGLFWNGKANYFKIEGDKIAFKGVFKVSESNAFSNYYFGAFKISSYGLLRSFRMPVGLHREYKTINNTLQEVSQLYYEDGMPENKTKNYYSYSNLTKYQNLKYKNAQILEDRVKESYAIKPSKSCPVCLGKGKEYVLESYKDTNTKYSEDDAYLYRKVTTSNKTRYKIIPCSRCGGSGKIK